MEKTIDEQLTSMRSTLWRQRVFNVVLVCTVVVAALSHLYFPQFGDDATFNTVNCETWNVIDANGNLRISATTTPDGSTSMTWLDKDGKPRIGASTVADGSAGMTWFDKDGKGRVGATTGADGTAGMAWLDKDGKLRISTGTAADGSARMTWFDKDVLRISTGTEADGNAGMTWFDKDGNYRITARTAAADSTVTLPTTDLKLKP